MTLRFNRKFIIGMVCGAALGIVLTAVGTYIVFDKSFARDVERIKSNLFVPEYPEHAPFSTYGLVDTDWPMRTLDGRETRLSEFAGKVVFLNRWATWCRSCVAEMPGIQRLYESMKDEEVVFLLVARQKEEKVLKFMEEEQFKLPVYLSDADLPNIFKSQGVPTTMIIDPNGEIVFKHFGSAKWDDDSSRKFIRGLM